MVAKYSDSGIVALLLIPCPKLHLKCEHILTSYCYLYYYYFLVQHFELFSLTVRQKVPNLKTRGGGIPGRTTHLPAISSSAWPRRACGWGFCWIIVEAVIVVDVWCCHGCVADVMPIPEKFWSTCWKDWCGIKGQDKNLWDHTLEKQSNYISRVWCLEAALRSERSSRFTWTC